MADESEWRWPKKWLGQGWWPHPEDPRAELEWILVEVNVVFKNTLPRVTEWWQCTGRLRPKPTSSSAREGSNQTMLRPTLSTSSSSSAREGSNQPMPPPMMMPPPPPQLALCPAVADEGEDEPALKRKRPAASTETRTKG